MIERKYIIPLRREFLKVQKYRRGYKSAKTIKEFLMQHMKVDDVKIGKELNQYILKHGRENPPSRVEVKAIKIEEKNEKPYVKVNLTNAIIEVENKEKKKGLKEKLKEKMGAKTDDKKTELEKEKHDVLEHAKIEHKTDIRPEGHVIREKRSPKAAKIIGDTGKK